MTTNDAPAPARPPAGSPATAPTYTAPTYEVRTFGCQMNVHDSERLAGLLEQAGYVERAVLPAEERPAVADVIVFNTCAVVTGCPWLLATYVSIMTAESLGAAVSACTSSVVPRPDR